MKNKKILIAEILVIFIIASALLLPNLIGTTEVETTDGYILSTEDLNSHVIGRMNDENEKQIISDFIVDAKQKEFQSIEDETKAIKNKEIDAFICKYDEATAVAQSNKDLVIFYRPLKKKSVTNANYIDLYYLVIRKEDCAYRPTEKSLDDLLKPGVKVAVLSGVVVGDDLKKLNPDCKLEYYNSLVDVYNALSKGKVDFCFGFDDTIHETIRSFPNVSAIPRPFSFAHECFALSKTDRGNELSSKLDSFIQGIQENGRYQQIFNKWQNGTENDWVLEETKYTGENGTLKICTGGTWFPNTFVNNNEISGTFIDACNLFCEEYGYIPEYYISDFAGEIAGLASGEYDLMADVCEDTPDRKESVNLTRPIMTSLNMVYTTEEATVFKTVSNASEFFNSIKNNFYKNFIDQSRYKMIFDGLWTTIKISISAALIGTLLGMLICIARMSDKTIINAFARIYIKAIQGTPIVVLLLILYYVVFAQSKISGFYVAIIGFSIDFSAYVAEIFRSGIESIPAGQTDAARALGFSSIQAFTKVVFPQALVSIVPVYSGQFISMVKLTSVVGYIAVEDLTKMSDLIRSATYEAFFPLISTAIIYFLLSTLLIQVLKIITNKIDPLKRSRIPKGVKTDVV